MAKRTPCFTMNPMFMLVAIASAALVHGYPERYTRRCWVISGNNAGTVMGVTPTESTALTLSFSPALLSNNRYVPGQTYVVTMANSNGNRGRTMLGSNAGTWSESVCSIAQTTGVRTSDRQGRWTAPNSGSVTLGASNAPAFGPVLTRTFPTLTPGPRPPPSLAPTTLSPTRSPASSAPTASPTQPPSSSVPTQAPLTSEPTQAPVTPAPTRAGDTWSPTRSPATTSPTTGSPATTSPTPSPVTPPTQAPLITTTGFLSDTVCTNGFVNTVDGVNVLLWAPNHTVDCMLLQYCIDSGFTVLEEVGGEYIAKYKLDPGGVLLAVAALNGLKERGVVNNVQFRITGTVVTGSQGNPMFQGSASYMGKGLGRRIVTTQVTALTAGPVLPYPLVGGAEGGEQGGADASSVGEDSNGVIAGGAIVCIVLVIVVAALVTTYAEKMGSKATVAMEPSGTVTKALRTPMSAGTDGGYLQVGGDVSVGDRVAVEGKGNGVVRFVGLHAENGKPRIGVELDDPVGKNNGTVKGHTYFTCKDNHGSLVSTDKITPQ